MGCPSICILGKNLTFSIQTNDGTGAPATPTGDVNYIVYEDTSTTEIITSTAMTKDFDGKTGFCLAQIECTAANGFERYKSYTIRITGTVAGVNLACPPMTFLCLGVEAIPAGGLGSGQTLSALKNICKYHGWSDFTTAGTAELANFINFTISMLSQLAPWPEYNKVNGSVTFSASDDQETLTTTGIIRVGIVVRSDRSAPLDEWSLEEHLLASKYHAGAGPPNKYALRRSVASGLILMEMLVYPKPTVETTLYYTYQVVPAWLSEDDDQTDWPNDRLWLLTDALRARLATIDRDTSGSVLYSSDFMTKVNRAFNAARPSFMPVIAKPLEWIRPGKYSLADTENIIV